MNRTMKNAMVGGTVVLALGVLPATLVLAAPATPPEERAFKGHTEISNMALGNVRGSFISADQILYFGVEMYTEWKTQAGGVYGASLNIGIDRSNGSSPTVHVTSNVQGAAASNGSGATSTSSGQISSGGLNQVQGVSQVVQTTGNGNGVTNTIGVDVGTQRPAMAGASASAQDSGNRTLVDTQTGTVAQTYINPTGAGVIVAVPTQGTASQSVASMIGLQQRAQVVGNANSVQNQLNMVIQVQNNSALNAARTYDLMQTVRGLGQDGIH